MRRVLLAIAQARALKYVPTTISIASQVGWSWFAQDIAGCRYKYLAKCTAHRTTAPAYVPLVNIRNSVEVLGIVGQELLVRASLACSPGGTVLWFDPARGTSKVVLGEGMNGGSANSALHFGTNNGVAG